MWIAECRCNDIKRGWEILTPVVCPVWCLISLYNAWIRYKIIIELFFYKIQYNNFTKTIKLLLVIRSLETLWKEVYSDSSRLDDVHVSSQHCVDDSPTFTQLTDSGKCLAPPPTCRGRSADTGSRGSSPRPRCTPCGWTGSRGSDTWLQPDCRLFCGSNATRVSDEKPSCQAPTTALTFKNPLRHSCHYESMLTC